MGIRRTMIDGGRRRHHLSSFLSTSSRPALPRPSHGGVERLGAVSVLPTAETSDNFGMGAAIQSETSDVKPAGAGAGQLLTGRADPKELEALIEPGVADPGDEMSTPPVAPQPMPTPRSNLGLGKLVSLPGWRWRRRATVRAQVEDPEARRVKVEQDLAARIDAVRREADTAHAAQVAALEAQATAQVEATRCDAKTALAILATELEAQAADRVAALEAQAAGQVEATRCDAETALAILATELEAQAAAQVAALEAQAAGQVEATRCDAETALAILATELEAHATTRLEAAVRDARADAVCAAAETTQQHDTALAAVRAQVEDAEARRVKTEQDLAVRVDIVRREADTAHAAQVVALEAKAAAQIEAAVREAQAEAAQMLVATMREHDVTLVRVRADAHTDVAQAEDQLAELKEFAHRVEAQTAAQVEAAVRASAETAQQREADVRARARADVTRAEERLADVERTLTAVRKEADLAQAKVERLHAERTDQRRQARREALRQLAHVLAHMKAQFSAMRKGDANTKATPATWQAVTRRGMAKITGAFVLAGFTGTLIGWYLAFALVS